MATIVATYGRLGDRLRGLGDVVIGMVVWFVAPYFIIAVVLADTLGSTILVLLAPVILLAGLGLVLSYGDALRGRGET
ncbi:MAG: hypothetical protein V3S20_07610, partial [Dehalococcoidia bacterium]